MKLRDTIELFASIAEDATRIFHKKIGKKKGLDSLEKQIHDETTSAAEESFGGKLDRVARVHIDRYVAKRMEYMRNAFKKLNNPKTDTSKQRANFIDDTETKSAREFGKAKGYERLSKIKDKSIKKKWINNEDSCEICQENANAGWIPVEEDFPSGDYAPLAHPNCDCDIIYSDEEGNME